MEVVLCTSWQARHLFFCWCNCVYLIKYQQLLKCEKFPRDAVWKTYNNRETFHKISHSKNIAMKFLLHLEIIKVSKFFNFNIILKRFNIENHVKVHQSWHNLMLGWKVFESNDKTLRNYKTPRILPFRNWGR